MADLSAISQNLIDGKAQIVKQLVSDAVAGGVAPQTILNEGLIVGMNEVGRRFKANEFYVPEVLLAARAMHSAMSVLKPLLAAAKVQPRGIVVLGTVKGDLHDIGKNLVGMMLEGSGFQVVDAGVDVAPDKFVAAVKENKPHVVAMSALLTTTMTNMKTTIQALNEAGVRKTVKVMVGGAPLTQRYADEIGADGYAPDAASAAELAAALMKPKKGA
jgi:5-methyltetrahydrofolate--homocysteine methyltransferase